MKKIPCPFLRDESDRSKLTREKNPACAWLFEPGAEGVVVPTRKWDGTACLVKDGKLFARYDAKNGKKPPDNFTPAQEPDQVTGHWPGWIPVLDQPHLKWHRLAWESYQDGLADGTYELCGPAVGANPDGFPEHVFKRHGDVAIPGFAVTWESCLEVLSQHEWEGVVFHGPDGQMAKIKRRDFGLPWAEKKKVA